MYIHIYAYIYIHKVPIYITYSSMNDKAHIAPTLIEHRNCILMKHFMYLCSLFGMRNYNCTNIYI